MTTLREQQGIDVAAVRDHFPSLSREIDGRPVVYLDGPGGTQVSRECIAAMATYLERSNANHGGAFSASVETDALLDEVHAAGADFLGAHDPDEIVFGPNMTTLTLSLSRALGRDLRPADEIVLTRLDHDANVAPWLAVAQERGVIVRWLEVDEADCTLDLAELERLVGPRTRVVAIGLASNAVGTINDVSRAISIAHSAGALTYIDAVHAAPHLPIDVSSLRTDFLVCSPYKFFAPHLGMLYGRREHLERLRAYRVRPAGDALPGKFETGTQNHEGLAGLLGGFEYLASLGRAYGAAPHDASRREALSAAMRAIRRYERSLIGPLIAGLQGVPGLRIRGIVDPARFDERVPTVAFTIEGRHPRRIAEHLATRAISTWDGDYYAWELIRALGLAAAGGMLRVGLVHYNRPDEIDALISALHELA
jgi:cysteine desulfurase family protein (TIGR01976 family)